MRRQKQLILQCIYLSYLTTEKTYLFQFTKEFFHTVLIEKI